MKTALRIDEVGIMLCPAHLGDFPGCECLTILTVGPLVGVEQVKCIRKGNEAVGVRRASELAWPMPDGTDYIFYGFFDLFNDPARDIGYVVQLPWSIRWKRMGAGRSCEWAQGWRKSGIVGDGNLVERGSSEDREA